MRVNGKHEPVSWSRALAAVAEKFAEVRNRNGRFGVIGSSRTSNEENYFLQKFARQGLGTANIDHRRSGDLTTLLDALSGKHEALATVSDLYTAKATLIVGADLAQQHPLLAFQIRANFRHHASHTYTVTPGPVRERKYAVQGLIAAPGEELKAIESLRAQLSGEPELVVLFGDSIQGDAVRRLVAFGDSLGIPVKYVCLVDYSNSRGAVDMGLLPDLLPGYHAASEAGMTVNHMLADPALDVLWVVGANPLENAALASEDTFVVVHEMFMTETAERADVIFPAASAYEKDGTVTNVCGQVQKLKRGPKTMGAKPDLEILGLLAKEMGLDLGVAKPDAVFEEIRKTVRGYNIALPVIATGGAAQTTPVNGRVPVESRPDLIQSARDTLFTSGSLGRYSKMLNSVMERSSGLYESGVKTP
jgi:NADH-quinone oxidoreductase subunit G